MALGLLLSADVPGHAQQPILEIEIAGVGQTLVQARLTEDGVLELPVAPIGELSGEDFDDRDWISLTELRTVLGPAVEIEYDARRALIRIRDPMARLAATQAQYDRRKSESAARPASFLLSGPYAALTAELDGGSLFEGGWNFGSASVGGAYSTESGARWDASVRLLDRAYVTYRDAESRAAAFGFRWSGGPTFFETNYAPESGDFRARAAASLGPWTFYVQEDGTATVSHRSVVQVTVGRSPDGFVTRLSYGRHPSPLSVPRVF